MEQSQIQLADFLKKSASELSISLPESAVPLFCSFLGRLKEWNKAINLTAIEDDREVVVKHFIDSIAGLKVIDVKEESCLLDVGAGAGFPALPLKFVRPDLSIELLEPNEKKGAFLRYVIGSLKLQQATVSTVKLEDYVDRHDAQRLFDYVVVRAFKVDQLGLALGRLLKPGGKVILYRSGKIAHDFKLTGLALVKEVEYELPAGYGHRALSVFSGNAE